MKLLARIYFDWDVDRAIQISDRPIRAKYGSQYHYSALIQLIFLLVPEENTSGLHLQLHPLLKVILGREPLLKLGLSLSQSIKIPLLSKNNRKKRWLRKKLQMNFTVPWRQKLQAFSITQVLPRCLPLMSKLRVMLGLVGPGEEVRLIREPHNPYDR